MGLCGPWIAFNDYLRVDQVSSSTLTYQWPYSTPNLSVNQSLHNFFERWFGLGLLIELIMLNVDSNPNPNLMIKKLI